MMAEKDREIALYKDFTKDLRELIEMLKAAQAKSAYTTMPATDPFTVGGVGPYSTTANWAISTNLIENVDLGYKDLKDKTITVGASTIYYKTKAELP